MLLYYNQNSLRTVCCTVSKTHLKLNGYLKNNLLVLKISIINH